MQRRARAGTGLSNVPARLLVLVLCTAAASAGVQVLQRAGGGAVASAIPGTATPSNTPVPNTATPSSTPSSTPSDTPVPNTATPSSTPSDTPVPNTATPSSTPSDTPGPASPTPSPSQTVTATPTITPTAEVGAALCSDGIDNNLNGLIDCADPSCGTAATCAAEAPALSPVLVLVGAACLALVGLLQLRRHLR